MVGHDWKDFVFGWTILIGAGLGALWEWGVGAAFLPAVACFATFVVMAAPSAGPSRKVFIAVAAGLTLWAVLGRDDAWTLIRGGLDSAIFILAFFTAVAWLRNAAETSADIALAGRYLAKQPPGRRYLALTAGGHLYGLFLSYGAIQLLGSLARASGSPDETEEVRTVRLRRMLLAIQRGFVATLAWSPLAFAVAITTQIVPGASWAKVLPFALVNAALLAGIGWALDTLMKPKLSGPAPAPQTPDRSPRVLLPLLLLLVLVAVAIGGGAYVTGQRATSVVMVAVPVISMAWVAVQGLARHRPLSFVLVRTRHYVVDDLPGYRPELLLLTMAGYIGTLGGRLAEPLIDASGIDVAALPPAVILVGIVWLLPLLGQAGMNPILSVSLIAPLLPDAQAIGIPVSALVIALTGGWAICGACSPYTATTLLTGELGRVSAPTVGLRWNGLYTLLCCAAVSLWAVLIASV